MATLPDTYQRVEYIESSGTQYIMLGTEFKGNYKVVIDFQMVSTGGDQIVLGVRYKSGGTSYRYGVNAYSSNFKVITGGSSWSNTKSEDTNRHTITLDQSTAIVDGTSYSSSYVNFTYPSGLCVFDYNRITGENNFPSSNKLYKLDVYDENSNHIYNLYPCYRISDGVIGLYDTVNDVFYTNAGTGTFTKGPNHPTHGKIKKIYVGTNLVRPKRHPGANTLVYLKLNGDATDSSGNGRNGTLSNNSGSYSWEYITGNSGTKCFHGHIGSVGSTRVNGGMLSGTYASSALGSNPRTVSIRMKEAGQVNIVSSLWLGSSGGGTNGEWFGLYHQLSPAAFGVLRYNSDPYVTGLSGFSSRQNYVITYDSSNLCSLYINGVKQTFSVNSSVTFNTLGTGYQLGALRVLSQSSNTDEYFSEFIIEDKAWTATEISNYYNITKGNYGL